jgi:hypothetical protein
MTRAWVRAAIFSKRSMEASVSGSFGAERKGSPQTLVCTKTRHSYLRRCAEYRQDIAALTALAELIEDSAGDCASHCTRIATAQERAAASTQQQPLKIKRPSTRLRRNISFTGFSCG